MTSISPAEVRRREGSSGAGDGGPFVLITICLFALSEFWPFSDGSVKMASILLIPRVSEKSIF